MWLEYVHKTMDNPLLSLDLVYSSPIFSSYLRLNEYVSWWRCCRLVKAMEFFLRPVVLSWSCMKAMLFHILVRLFNF